GGTGGRGGWIPRPVLLPDAGFLEVAGFDVNQAVRVDMLAERRADLLGGKRGYFGFQRLVELQGAVESLARGEQPDQGAILGAAHAALLDPGLLRRGYFVGGESILERLGEFI